MVSYFERLKNAPLEQRNRIVFLGTLLVFCAIFFVWLMLLINFFSRSDPVVEPESETRVIEPPYGDSRL
jgi:hypothetical protein